MRPAVATAWHAFSSPLEGRVHHMYLDVLGLVTTGVGNLIDSQTNPGAGFELAAALPWKKSDGSRASRSEVFDQWSALKNAADTLKKRHFKYAKDHLEQLFRHALWLNDDDIDALVQRQLEANETELRKHFPKYDEWPADAQLALHSMAWAMGSAFSWKFPTFTGLARRGDFELCGTQNQPGGRAPCDINTVGNPGVVPRNALNREHWVAAGSELARLFPDVLHGPCTLGALQAGWKQAGKLEKAEFEGEELDIA